MWALNFENPTSTTLEPWSHRYEVRKGSDVSLHGVNENTEARAFNKGFVKNEKLIMSVIIDYLRFLIQNNFTFFSDRINSYLLKSLLNTMQTLLVVVWQNTEIYLKKNYDYIQTIVFMSL